VETVSVKINMEKVTTTSTVDGKKKSDKRQNMQKVTKTEKPYNNQPLTPSIPQTIQINPDKELIKTPELLLMSGQ